MRPKPFYILPVIGMRALEIPNEGVIAFFGDFVSSPTPAKRSGKYKVHDIQIAPARLKIDENYKVSDNTVAYDYGSYFLASAFLTAVALTNLEKWSTTRVTYSLSSSVVYIGPVRLRYFT
uniref:DUF5683 domain-containing protein n=1 Tax=Heterorhabditis bacteriophora TaxID=37862 RepID=A0A1I7WF01_HETBA